VAILYDPIDTTELYVTHWYIHLVVIRFLPQSPKFAPTP